MEESGEHCFISRLCILKMISVLAQKVRAAEFSASDSALVLQRFRNDIRGRRFRVAALSHHHYQSAENLLGKYGHGLRALDALHLAIALDLRDARLVDAMIAADRVICRVSPLEALRCINPEASP